MKTKTIVFASVGVVLLGAGLYFIFRKKKSTTTATTNTNAGKDVKSDSTVRVQESEPEFEVNVVSKKRIGTSVDFTFGEKRNTYDQYSGDYFVAPYENRKSIYALRTTTIDDEDNDVYGMINFDLYRNGVYVKTLYQTT